VVRTIAVVQTTDWLVPEPGRDGAYLDCPCAHNVGDKSLDMIFPEQVVEKDGVKFLQMLNSKHLVHPGYGSSMCSTWSSSTLYPECGGQSLQPEWCTRKWCYVNPSLCQRRSVGSPEFPGLSYSFETCGNLDYYVQPHLRRFSNATRTLYAYGFGFKAEENPEANSVPLNMCLAFAAKALSQAGIDPQSVRYRRELSNATRREFSSTYTGCVHDVALGNLDVCLGDIWDTAQRRSFGRASFVRVSGEQIFLIGPKPNATETWLDMLGKPFAPFNWDVWCMVFAVVFATSVAMLMFEFHRKDSDFADDSLFNSLCKSLYYAISSFVNQGVAYTSVTLSGRIMAIGYGLFILICITSFTAETANFLISSSLRSQYNSVDDVLEAKLRICYSLGMQEMLEGRHPSMKQFGVPIDAAAGSVFGELMTNGTCEYGIIGEQWMDDSWELGEFCNLQFIGTPILVLPIGYWVSDDLRSLLGWSVAVESSAGTWGEVQRRFEKEGHCAENGRRLNSHMPGKESAQDAARVRRLEKSDASSISATSGPNRLGSRQMMGAFLVPAICGVIASLIRVFELCWCGLDKEDKDLLCQMEDGALKELSAVVSFGRKGSKAVSEKLQSLHVQGSKTTSEESSCGPLQSFLRQGSQTIAEEEANTNASPNSEAEPTSPQGGTSPLPELPRLLRMRRLGANDEKANQNGFSAQFQSPQPCERHLPPSDDFLDAEEKRLVTMRSLLEESGKRLAEQRHESLQSLREERYRLEKMRDAIEEERKLLEAERNHSEEALGRITLSSDIANQSKQIKIYDM